MFNFLHFPLTATSRPLSILQAINALAAADVGAWVLDEADERAWTLKGALELQRARFRLYDGLTSGQVPAYVKVSQESGYRIVDADYWRRGNSETERHSRRAAVEVVPDLALTPIVVGRGVPDEVQGLPAFVLEDDLTAIIPQPTQGPAHEVQTAQAGDPVRPEIKAPLMRRRGVKSGPKEQPWASHLRKIFQTHHDRMTEMSERQRHNFVGRFCNDLTGRPKSARTTESHWQIHLDSRAAQ